MFPKTGVNPNHPILIRFSIIFFINHRFWGKIPPIFGCTANCTPNLSAFFKLFFFDVVWASSASSISSSSSDSSTSWRPLKRTWFLQAWKTLRVTTLRLWKFQSRIEGMQKAWRINHKMLIRVYMDSAPSFSISRSPRKNRVWLVKSIFLHHFILPHQKPPIHPGIAEPNQRYQEKLTYHLKKTAILIVVFGDMNRTLTGCVFFFRKIPEQTNTQWLGHQGWLSHHTLGTRLWGYTQKTCNVQLTFAKQWKDSETFPLSDRHFISSLTWTP